MPLNAALPHGIVPVLQTPFTAEGAVDFPSLERLIEDAITARAAGLLVPAVASEVAYLTSDERRAVLACAVRAARGRVPIVAGASTEIPAESRTLALQAAELGANACLIAVPTALYATPAAIPEFFRVALRDVGLPAVVQDLDWSGSGLSLESLAQILDAAPQVAGIKVETVPAGPKYSSIRRAFGGRLHISGGWAIQQMIEALDRGVDAMIPEASMVRVYDAIFRLHTQGRRGEASALFRRLLPVVAFTNQEIRLSIAFYKRLLVRKGLFTTAAMRWPGFEWDPCNSRIADELLDRYLELAAEIAV